ncbi:MAG: helix-turn-helix domain-containing protein [Gammaproteobacteria bacterium]
MLIANLSTVRDDRRREFLQTLARDDCFVSLCNVHDLTLCQELPAYTLRLVVRGTLTLDIAGTRTQLAARQYVVANPDQSVEIVASSGPAKILLLVLRSHCVRDAHRGVRGTAQRILHDDSRASMWPVHFSNRVNAANDTVSPLLGDLQRIVELGVRDADWLARQYAVIAERLLFAQYRRRNDEPVAERRDLGHRLDETRRLMEEQYADALDLSRLAALTSVSVHYFLRQFKRRYGKTPHRYLVDIRLREARALLRTTSMSVGDIGREVGFGSTNGFHGAFRSRYGQSPGALRVAQRNLSEGGPSRPSTVPGAPLGIYDPQ